MPLPPAGQGSGAGAISYYSKDCLAGRVALITGGGSGIGFEIAQQLCYHGAKGVVLVGRRKQFLDEAVALLAKQGIQAAASAGDIRKPEDCAAAVKMAVDSFGSLDIVVNCAAGNFLATAEGLSPNGFKTVLDIDTQGMFNMTTAAFKPLKESRFGGVVTSITSTLHYTATWYQSAPVAAKAAIDALTRNLALEWGEYGIRCNCIAPGPVMDTPGLDKLSGGKSAEMKWPNIPLKRAATKAEIASTCIYFCVNTLLTGVILAADGGEWFGKPQTFPREMVSQVSRGVEAGSRAMGAGAKAPTSKL